MDESNLDKFIKRETEQAKKDREKNDYRNQEPFSTKRVLEENLRLIKEKDFEQGKKVWLKLLKMKGEVIEIRKSERSAVVVKREDGEVFAYSPQEMEPIEDMIKKVE